MPAPDNAGQHRANRAALIASTAMLLFWLAERQDKRRLARAAHAQGLAMGDTTTQTPDPGGMATNG